MEKIKQFLENEIKKSAGIIKLNPAWVARNFIAPGRRFSLPESAYRLGSRGGICERWLASTTKADNRVSVPNEGLSTLKVEFDREITLKETVELFPDQILGKEYTKDA